MTNKHIQQMLEDAGYYDGDIDGIFGPKSEKAIKAFQKAAGLPATGTADAKTVAALKDLPKKAEAPKSVEAKAGSDTPHWMTIAAKYNGLREIKGKANNAKILEWFAACGFDGINNDETAWCAAFVGGVLAEAGIKGSGNLMARSYEKWGKKIKQPVFGCIGSKKRTGAKASSPFGHVGFVVAANDTHVWMLGGNQNDMVNVSRFARADFTSFNLPAGYDASSPDWPKLPSSAAGAKKATEA